MRRQRLDSERLLVERAIQRLSIQELAERSGVNAHTISEIERGVRNPRATTVAKIAEGLGLKPEELLGKVPAPSTSGLSSRGEERNSADEPVPLTVAIERMKAAGHAAQQVAHDWRRESERSLEEGRPLTKYRTLEMYSFHNELSRLFVDNLKDILEAAELGLVGIDRHGVKQYLSPNPALWPHKLKKQLHDAGVDIAALPKLIEKIELEASEQYQGGAERALYEEFNVENNREELNKVLSKVGN
jgi:transcriptional regulator with XRE-family HTH domain